MKKIIYILSGILFIFLILNILNINIFDKYIEYKNEKITKNKEIEENEKINYLKGIIEKNENLKKTRITIDGEKVDYDIINNTSKEGLEEIINNKNSIFHDEVIEKIKSYEK